MKPNVPKVSDLKKLYADYASTLDEIQRLAILRNAVRWYLAVAPFKGSKVTRSPNYAKATKMADRGLQSTTLIGEADTSCLFSLAYYEKAFDDASMPTIEGAKLALETNRPHLEQKADSMRAKCGPFLEMMNDAFKPVGVKYMVVKQERNRVVGADKVIRVSDAYASIGVRELRSSGAAYIIRELPAVIRALSIVKGADGSPRLDPALLNVKLGETCDALGTSMGSLAPVVPIAPAAAPRVATTPTPRAPRAAGSLFRPGTMTGELYDRLVAALGSDSNVSFVTVSVASLIDGLKTGDSNALINDLVVKGRNTGVYTLVKDKKGNVTFTPAPKTI